MACGFGSIYLSFLNSKYKQRSNDYHSSIYFNALEIDNYGDMSRVVFSEMTTMIDADASIQTMGYSLPDSVPLRGQELTSQMSDLIWFQRLNEMCFYKKWSADQCKSNISRYKKLISAYEESSRALSERQLASNKQAADESQKQKKALGY